MKTRFLLGTTLALFTTLAHLEAQRPQGSGITYESSFWIDPDFAINDAGKFNETDLFATGVFLSAPIPVAKTKRASWAIAPQFQFVSLDFKGDERFQDRNLYSIALNILTRVNVNEKWSLRTTIRPALSTDFERINSNSFFATATAGASYRWRDNFILTAGAIYISDFGEHSVYPFAGALWYPNEQWSLRLTPPEILIEYKPVDKWTLFLETRLAGGQWTVANDGLGDEETLELIRWRTGLGVGRQLNAFSRLELSAGANLFQQMEIRDTAGNAPYDSNWDESVYIKFAWKAFF